MRLLRRWLPIAIVVAIGTGVVTYAVTGIIPPVWEAKTTLIVGQSLSAVNPDYSQLLASQRLSATYAQLATTRPIVDRVMDRLGIDETHTEFLKRMHVTAAVDSTLLTIAATDGSPTVAASIANAIADELVRAAPEATGIEASIKDFVTEELRDTQAAIESTQAEVTRLLEIDSRSAAENAELNVQQTRLTSLRSSFASLVAFVTSGTANILAVVEPAAEPDEPVWPRRLLSTLLASLLAVLIVVLLVLLAAYLDDGLRDSDDVRETLDLPTIGMVPRMQGDRSRSEIYRLVTLTQPRSAAAEAFRTMRTNLEFTSVDAPLKVIMVTSPDGGAGKTVTSANLAVAFAQAGRRVLLIDADLRKPGIQAIFALKTTQGLSDLLRSGRTRWQSVAATTEQPNLQILTTGPTPPNPAELLGTQRMRAAMDDLRASFDIVVIDSPPLLPVADAAILSTYADGTILVVDSRRTRRDAARRAHEVLDRAGARVVGVVVNRLRFDEEELYAAYT